MSDETRGHPFGRRSNGKASGRANGSVPDGLRTRPVPVDDVREPLDLVAVQADDELISALASGLQVTAPGRGGYDADDHVAAMLAAWKADVDADPIPEIDLDEAVGAVLAGRRNRPSGRMRHLVPIASAAALVVVAITGVSIAAHDTRPGDALFPISKVLYSDEAESYEALAQVEQSRERAKEALAAGDKQAAEAALAEGQAAAENVLAEHGRGVVEQRLHKLEVVVDQTEPGVPTYVEDDEDEPSQGGGRDEDEPGATDPSTTPSQEPSSDPSGDPSDSRDEDPTSDQPEPGTTEPDSSEPGTADKPRPDPRIAAEPGPATKEPSDADEPGSGSTGGTGTGTGSGTGEPAPDTATSPPPPEPSSSRPAPRPNVDDDPTTPKEGSGTAGTPASPPATTTAPSSHTGSTGTPGTTGISGASMSATGTATPSGEPTT